MESLELDSTHDLLNRYKTKDGKNDDITIYSDEESIFNSPSIELGRSAVKNAKGSSPFKRFDMGRSNSLSPSKKVRNDYQDHLHRMRGTSNTGSPLKRNNYDLSEYNDFDDIKGMSGLNIDSLSGSDSTMDKEIQRILDMSSLKLPKLQDDHGKDKTELLIKETHKLISTVPASITSSKEGEAYQKMLTTSINKLIKQVETMKRDVDKKDSDAKSNRIQLSNLEMKMGLYQRENSDLKKELNQAKRRSVTPQNDTRENDLLRTKLIKYRNLYTESERENQELKSKLSGGNESARQQTPVLEARPTSQAKSVDIPSAMATPIASVALLQDAYKHRLIELQNQLSDIINDVKDEPLQPEVQPMDVPKQPPHQVAESNEIQDSYSQPSLRMLAIFEDLVRAMKNESIESKPLEKQYIERQSLPKETPPNEPMEKESEKDQANPNDPVLEKILTSIDKNNQMYNKLLEVFNSNTKEQQVHINEPIVSPKLEEDHHIDPREREKDIVFQCYVCCPQNHKFHAKRPCKRCSAASSEASGSAGNSATHSATHSAGNSASDSTSNPQVRDSVPNHMADFSDSKDNKTINLMGEYKWTI
ncbi:uncharacterized protein AC631_03692 [Debaryomyces fabryi]|uniref:Uncharacterized protein n=1 Tax=Debaryomyces fabryi TaxID=58627 RepID=A0A0V1PWC9_9ASCO|nr:uncharacterized protein AC631_03692 [Debaryomyces fabryi]KSA00551.1 hypothetical protein AC631_03692 [Debaryomyces fabryi]CUM57029.1 unnamed protein product [Debaryomyces fabryi]